MTTSVCVFVEDPLPGELTDPARELGGKGAWLRQLHAAGVRVPRGFTIGAGVCRSFLADDAWPSDAWTGVQAALDRLLRQIGQNAGEQTTEASGPTFRVAVRSGAAVSMPGLLRTLLDVPCERPPASEHDSDHESGGDRYHAVRSAIEEVFRSWNCPAAEHYRQRLAIDTQMATAVNVQEMIDCIASGVLFTKSGDRAEGDLIIEAVAGSGDSLVSGRVTPLRWVVRRQDRQILEGPGADADVLPVLTGAVPELIAVGLRLEQDFAVPLDIEWGIDAAGLVFFQARPVDAVPPDEQLSEIRAQQIALLRRMSAGGTRCWVRHNLSETLSHPTPLTWNLWRQFTSGGGGLGRLYRMLGYRPGRRVREKSFLSLIGGQIYADPDLSVVMFGDAWPWSYSPDRLRENPSLLDQPPRHFDPLRLGPWFIWRVPSLLWRMWRAQRRIETLMSCAADDFEQQAVPEMQRFVAHEHNIALKDLDEFALQKRFELRRQQVMDNFAPRSLLPGTLGAIALAELTRQIVRILGPDAASLAHDLTPAGDVRLARRQQELLARWNEPSAHTAFLEEFGQRAIGEMELAIPRWRETPELVAGFATESAATVLAAQELTHEVSRERLRQEFTDAGAASLVREAVIWLDRCWQLLPYRDRGRHLWLRTYEQLRHVAQELAERFSLGDDFYFLTPDEWPDLVAGRDVRSRIDGRRREATAFQRWHLPAVIDPERLNELLKDAPVLGETSTLRGTPLSGGYGAGRVWNRSAGCGPHGESNCVLVCEALEPSLVPMLAGTVAVVVQQGGMLSHGAILARQIRLPVVRLDDAMQLLVPGQEVGVDGQTGQVSLLKRGLS